MKELKFKDVIHQSWESCDGVPEAYKIDWARNEEKYKTPIKSYLRVYQGGRVSLHTNGYRSPDLRALLLNSFGIDLRVTADIRNMKFFTPDGYPVPKSTIKSDTLLLDHEHKIALTGYKSHWVDTGYAPKSEKQIVCKTRCKETEAKFMAEWKDVLDLAVTMRTINKTDMMAAHWNFQDWMAKPRTLNPVDNVGMLLRLGFEQLSNKTNFDRLITNKCMVEQKFDYLKFEERKV